MNPNTRRKTGKSAAHPETAFDEVERSVLKVEREKGQERKNMANFRQHACEDKLEP